jgi:hypothetical protein
VEESESASVSDDDSMITVTSEEYRIIQQRNKTLKMARNMYKPYKQVNFNPIKKQVNIV